MGTDARGNFGTSNPTGGTLGTGAGMVIDGGASTTLGTIPGVTSGTSLGTGTR